MSGMLAIVHFALHTYSRAYLETPMPPQLGSASGRTGQVAGVSRLDGQPPPGPRARASKGIGAHRWAWRAVRAPARRHAAAVRCRLTTIKSSF